MRFTLAAFLRGLFRTSGKGGFNLTITLYSIDVDPRTMPKPLVDGTGKTGSLRNAAEVVNPVILVSGNVDANYLYIPDFNRYYFINSITHEITGVSTIYAHCDVLQSFYDEIINLPCIVKKAESNGAFNSFIPDNTYHDKNNHEN